MHRITNTGRVNLGHLFWLRSLAIIGQLVTIAVVQTFVGVHLPLPAMLLVIGLETVFNGLTWLRVSKQRPESNLELFGQLWVDLGALSALLFLSGGTTNPFVSLYLPSLAIAAAVLPWHLMLWLAGFAVACYAVLGFDSVPLNLDNPANLFDYYRAGMWVNFTVSVGLIAWFVARMSRALRQRDACCATNARWPSACRRRRSPTRSVRRCRPLLCCPKSCAMRRAATRALPPIAPTWNCSSSR
jgi:two-component system sensor histidine kinase RegB